MSLNKIIRDHHFARREGLVVTPVLHQFLMKNDGVPISEEVADHIRDMMVATGGGPSRDRSGHFHPSQIGTCQRRHVFTYLGVPDVGTTDSTLQNLFNDGTWRHMRWQAMGLTAGFLNKIEVKVRRKKYRIGGSMDGEGEDSKGAYGFELKGTRALSKVVKDGPFDSVYPQVGSYFLMRPDLKRFSIVYEDKSSQDWKEFVFKRSAPEMKEAMKLARRDLVELNIALDDKKLPHILPECVNGKGKTFRECPFRKVCLETNWEQARKMGIQERRRRKRARQEFADART